MSAPTTVCTSLDWCRRANRGTPRAATDPAQPPIQPLREADQPRSNPHSHRQPGAGRYKGGRRNRPRRAASEALQLRLGAAGECAADKPRAPRAALHLKPGIKGFADCSAADAFPARGAQRLPQSRPNRWDQEPIRVLRAKARPAVIARGALPPVRARLIQSPPHMGRHRARGRHPHPDCVARVPPSSGTAR